jgi:hypothetical protein
VSSGYVRHFLKGEIPPVTTAPYAVATCVELGESGCRATGQKGSNLDLTLMLARQLEASCAPILVQRWVSLGCISSSDAALYGGVGRSSRSLSG